MTSREPAADDDANDSAEYIPFQEFSVGLSSGRFRVIVNPTLVTPFVNRRTHATALALALIGPGIAFALYGHAVAGAVLVAAGILLRRVIKTKAPRILLHLTTRVPSIYEEATETGVMEVRRA